MRFGTEKHKRFSCLMFGYEPIVLAIDDPDEKPPNNNKFSGKKRGPFLQLGSNLIEKMR